MDHLTGDGTYHVSWKEHLQSIGINWVKKKAGEDLKLDNLIDVDSTISKWVCFVFTEVNGNLFECHCEASTPTKSCMKKWNIRIPLNWNWIDKTISNSITHHTEPLLCK